MRLTKKLFCFICLCLLFISLCGCDVKVPEADNGKLTVITTSFPPYDFVRQIGGDHVKVDMLLAPAQESHSFEPTPQDIIALGKADLFIAGGGTSDEWVRKLISSSELNEDKVLFMMDCVEAKETQQDEPTSHTHDHSHLYEYDEHVWTSPVNAKRICEEILARLIKMDTKNETYYNENAEAYFNALNALDSKFHALFDGAQKTLIFADRFPFRYFADEYGLAYFAAFPGCAGETEPDAATMKFLIDKVKNDSIPTVFYTELSNQKIADSIVEATGAEKKLLHSCHTVTKEEFDRGETYLSLMEQNLLTLKEALF